MTAETLKHHALPAIIGSVITFICSSAYHQLTTVKELSEMRTTLELYVPNMDRRVTNVETHAATNDKRLDLVEVQLARLE